MVTFSAAVASTAAVTRGGPKNSMFTVLENIEYGSVYGDFYEHNAFFCHENRPGKERWQTLGNLSGKTLDTVLNNENTTELKSRKKIILAPTPK